MAIKSSKTTAFMQDFTNFTQAHPWDNLSRILGSTMVQVYPVNGEIHLSDIQTLNPKSGAGTTAIQHLLKLADKHGVVITGTAKAYAPKGAMISTSTRLRKWYEKLGFKVIGGNKDEGFEIKYTPKKETTANLEVSAKAPFTTYAEAQAWVKAKEREYGGKLKFHASEEYHNILPLIQKLYKESSDTYNAELKRQAAVAMKKEGVSFGDRVQYSEGNILGGRSTIQGTVFNKAGVPYVRIDKKYEYKVNKLIGMWSRSWKPIKEESTASLELAADEWWNKLNGEERRAYVAAHPKSRYAHTFSKYQIPPEPGTTSIPEGHVRLYHQTNERYLRNIRRNGLEARQPTEGPRGLYADEDGFYGKPEDIPTVEFHVPKEDWDRPFVKTNNSIYAGRVSPENIIAVHHPWHRSARFIENEPQLLDEVLRGEHDDLLSDPQYNKPIRLIKHRYGVHVPAGEIQETSTLFSVE